MRSMAEIFESWCVRDEHGRHKDGTDKVSNHNYAAAYESLFPDRDAIRLVMEVGVAGGAGMLAWREIFQRADIVGLDIHPCAACPAERLEFHLGDQRRQVDCARAAAGRQFDFILDDATHMLENNLLTMFWLWPFVRPGGVYVVEEFANVGAYRKNITALWPQAEILDTVGPFGGIESLVILRKIS